MLFRETGMPDEQTWDTYFDPVNTLLQLGVSQHIRTLIDIGCGYGTFLIPASTLIAGTAIGIDINERMLQVCEQKVREQVIQNVVLLHGDITAEQTTNNLKNQGASIDFITMFNILHCEQPVELLETACQLLDDNGKVGVIHWIYGDTPRGPSMDIRPTPEMICTWAEKAGFILEKQVDLQPYHYGLVFEKAAHTTPEGGIE